MTYLIFSFSWAGFLWQQWREVPLEICNSTKIARSEVVFSVEVIAFLLVITLWMMKSAFFDVACDDKLFLTTLFWGTVEYFTPNRNSWKVFFSLEIFSMSLVWPPGLKKTRLFFVLTLTTIFPGFEKINYFFFVYQIVFQEASMKMNIGFNNCLVSVNKNTLQDCLLISDGSCGENLSREKFSSFWLRQKDLTCFCQTQFDAPKSIVAHTWNQEYTNYSLQFISRESTNWNFR